MLQLDVSNKGAKRKRGESSNSQEEQKNNLSQEIQVNGRLNENEGDCVPVDDDNYSVEDKIEKMVCIKFHFKLHYNELKLFL